MQFLIVALLVWGMGTSVAVADQNVEDDRMDPIAAHGIPVSTTYSGQIQGPSGRTFWTLSLWPDQTFQLVRRFGPDGASRSSLGRWHADPSRDALVLNDGAEMSLVVSKAPKDQLRVLDADTGNAFEGQLENSGNLAPVDLDNMLIGGMMTYLADAALLVECLSGTAFPIAQEGDYLSLERAYVRDREEPGAQLYVMLEGDIAIRAGMEGPPRQTIVVDRFIRTRQGITCERQKADTSLQNVYWRLDQIDGENVQLGASTREPHLVLESGTDTSFRATLGCNLLRGRYSLDENSLAFAPTTSTMMACPPPLDEVEQLFVRALQETIGFAIEGETLILKDEQDTPRAIFTAIYLR